MSGPARRAGARPLAAVSAVPDVLGPGLSVVFCGINPGFVSDAAKAHFANPRNDFWRLLHAAGFTSRLYEPSEQFEVLREGIGLTNAAPRTTRGSGDLRRADFAGAAERLEQLARELEPGWIAFVGKEAYRGAFNERPELGLQARRLGETRLFVLPSTSPANAAVPWDERLRWFQELAGRATGRPLRQAVRALVVDSRGRVLLLRYDFPIDFPQRVVWAPPGGGLDARRNRRTGAAAGARRGGRARGVRARPLHLDARALVRRDAWLGWPVRADPPRSGRTIRPGAAG